MACDSSRPDNQCKHENLDEVQEYLKHPEYFLLYNYQRFEVGSFNKKDYIKNEAKILNMHVDKRQANWMNSFLSINEVQD